MINTGPEAATAKLLSPPFPYEKDFFGAEKFALKYDVPDDINPYNKMCKSYRKETGLMGLGGSFHNSFEKRPVLFARASAKICKQDFSIESIGVSLDKKPTKQ